MNNTELNRNYRDRQIEDEAKYILLGNSIADTARHFKMNESTVSNDMHKNLQSINYTLWTIIEEKLKGRRDKQGK